MEVEVDAVGIVLADPLTGEVGVVMVVVEQPAAERAKTTDTATTQPVNHFVRTIWD